jgi:hypothetical protein
MDEGYVLSYSSSNSGAVNGVGERCSLSGSTIVVDSFYYSSSYLLFADSSNYFKISAFDYYISTRT